MYWRSPTEIELKAMIDAGAHVWIKAGARSYMNGRLKLSGHTWLDKIKGLQNDDFGGIFIDGVVGVLARFYRPHDNTFHGVDKDQGDLVRCVRDNKRQ